MNKYGDIRQISHALGYLALAGVIMDLIFWSLYLSNIIVLGEPGDIATARFESAFMLADIVLGISLLIAGAGLLRNKPHGGLFLIVASSMGLYLGILDVTFYFQGGLYSSLSYSNVLEIIINLTCIVGGILGLLFGAVISRKLYDHPKTC